MSVYQDPSGPSGSQAPNAAPFCQWVGGVAKAFPSVTSFIVGNEVNTTRFWAPQHTAADPNAGPDSYEALLAQCYDTLKAINPNITVIGMGLSPRAVDSNSTAPLAFIRAVGAAYKASGRSSPIMDELAVHPYPNPNASPPPPPNLAGYQNPGFYGITQLGMVKQAVYDAFDGTGQPTTLTGLQLVVDEIGYQSDETGNSLYTGSETSPTVSEVLQASYYSFIVGFYACDPSISAVLLFHLKDEANLNATSSSGGWQSGLERPDGSQKPSYSSVKQSVALGCRGHVVNWSPVKGPLTASITGTSYGFGQGGGHESVQLKTSAITNGNATLARGSTTLGTINFLELPAGTQQVLVPIPPPFAPGVATLTITLTDDLGRVVTIHAPTVVPVAAAGPPPNNYLSFLSTPPPVNTGQSITVPIWINIGSGSVDAAAITLNYPSYLMEVTGVTLGNTDWTYTSLVTAGNGTVTFDLGAPRPFSGKSLIGTVTFKTSHAGTGMLLANASSTALDSKTRELVPLPAPPFTVQDRMRSHEPKPNGTGPGRRHVVRYLFAGLILVTVATMAPSASSAPAQRKASSDTIWIAALGDSYTAGNGLGGQNPITNVDNTACHGKDSHRSYDAYPWRLLADSSIQAKIWDDACSGATTDDISTQITDTVQHIGSAAKLVVLTIGGNDLNFSGIIPCLFSPVDVIRLFSLAAGAAGIPAGITTAAGLTAWCGAQINANAKNVPDVLQAVRGSLLLVHVKMPNAVVALVGYPTLTVPGCNSLWDSKLASLQSRFDLGEIALVAELNADYGQHFRFLEVGQPFANGDHGPCAASSNQWVRGVDLNPYWASFHPNAVGNDQIAKLLISHGALTWAGASAGGGGSVAGGGVTTTPTSAGGTSSPPPSTGSIVVGYHIEDDFLGGTWARTDPNNGTWYSHSNPPPNGAYWYPNNLGVGVDCARAAASYTVKFADGHTETWNTWFHVTDGKWYPSAATREVYHNGSYGLPSC